MGKAPLLRWMPSLLLALTVLAGCSGLRPEEVSTPGPATAPIVVSYRVVDGAIVPLAPGPGLAQVSIHALGVETMEPAIAVTAENALLVTAYEQVLRSLDGGATWQVVQSYAALQEGAVQLPNGGHNPGIPFTLDPWIAVDPVTDRVFSNHLTLACTTTSWSDDAGTTWSPWWPASCATPTVDFQKLAAGPVGPQGNPKAGVEFPSVAYLCYNKVLGAIGAGTPAGHYGLACATSYDGGLRWENEHLLTSNVRVADQTVIDDCAGAAYSIAIAPDGTAVVRALHDKGGGCLFATFDSGASWTRQGNGPAFSGSDLAYDAAGTLYALSGWWDGALRVASSPDNGKTWSDPWPVAPPSMRGVLLPALAAGAQGRLFVAFLGTEEPLDEALAGNDRTRWHAWLLDVQDADSAKPLVTAYRATPDDAPMYIGPGAADLKAGLYLGDFVTAAIGPDGTGHVVFPDACNDGCEGNPEASRDDQAKLGSVVSLDAHLR